jgi:hypothetical protein
VESIWTFNLVIMRLPTILLPTFLVLSIGLQGQHARQELPHLHGQEVPPAPAQARPWKAPAKPPTAVTKASVIELGRMQNAYSMQQPAANQVHHVPELDAVVFVRRQNPADHDGLGGSSLRFDHSTDGGATWQIGGLLSPELFAGNIPGNGARHPNGFLYNPPGNTDPANAWVVAQAPSVSPTNNFRMLMAASARLDGSGANDAYTNLWPGQSTGWVQGLHQAANGHAWSIATNIDTADQSNSRSEFKVMKGTWNAGTERMDWEVAATLTADFGTYEFDGQTYHLNLDWSVAFGPDGQTGYAVVTGRVVNGPPCNTYPIVWKTEDAGANWNLQAIWDHSQEQVFTENLYPAQGSGLVRPYFRRTAITVDAANTLHLFAEVLSGYHSSPDSANWIYVDPDTRVLAHAYTASEDDWTVAYVADVVNVDGFPFGPNVISQGSHPQMARTPDGTKIFMAWASTFDLEENVLPDIHARAYDVNTGLYSAEKVLTEGTPAELSAYWFQLAPTVIVDGDDHGYELPITYLQPGTTDLQPATAFYLKGVGFDEGEINVGIDEVGTAGRLALFPNPGDGRFTLLLEGMGPAELWITDITGRVVYQGRVNSAREWIDLGDRQAGTYIVTVDDGRRRLGTKLMVTGMR